MKVCDCYRQLEPIQLMVGECLGAKNKPKVDCCGDESRCLFYSDRRRKAKAVTNADRIRAMSDEELADFIGGIFTLERDLWGDYDPRTVVTQEPRVELRSREDVLDWLKQEAEGV